MNNTSSEDSNIVPDSNPEQAPSNDAAQIADQDAEGLQDQEQTRYKEGEILRLVRVRFPGNNKSFAFTTGGRDFYFGEKVVAMSDRGMAVGYVNSFPYDEPFTKELLPLRSIARGATAEDMLADQETFRQEKRLGLSCEKIIERNQLDMVLTHVQLTQFGKKAVFFFTAPTRVDFRGLVHELVSELKMRIELRQISVRDRAAAVGGLGPCGRELCCSSFLAKYGNVGIKLAKNQDLSLNSSKINGVCGQLKCCLTYEDEVYAEKRKKMPRDNALVKLKDGNQGKVVALHIIIEQFDVINADGMIRRYVADMWDGMAEKLEIPKYFENGIHDHTKTVIGLSEALAAKAQEHQKAITEAKVQAKGYADDVFENLFGAKSLDWSLPEVDEPQGPKRNIIRPEEEEEIVYVAPEDEILDDDEMDEDGDEWEDDEDGPQTAPEADAARPPVPRTQMAPQERQGQQYQGARQPGEPRSPGPRDGRDHQASPRQAEQHVGPRNDPQRADNRNQNQDSRRDGRDHRRNHRNDNRSGGGQNRNAGPRDGGNRGGQGNRDGGGNRGPNRPR